MTVLSPPPSSNPPCIVRIGLCTEQERVVCVRCKSKYVTGPCLGIAKTTNCFEVIFSSFPSCLPTFTTQLSAPDQMSALDVKLKKVDALISEDQSMKLDINSLTKPSYLYLRADFRN